jgi:hypothetical protein
LAGGKQTADAVAITRGTLTGVSFAVAAPAIESYANPSDSGITPIVAAGHSIIVTAGT